MRIVQSMSWMPVVIVLVLGASAANPADEAAHAMQAAQATAAPALRIMPLGDSITFHRRDDYLVVAASGAVTAWINQGGDR